MSDTKTSSKQALSISLDVETGVVDASPAISPRTPTSNVTAEEQVNDGFDEVGKNYTVIVLSGGPRAGKTTVMQLLMDRLRSLGYIVYIAIEAASALLSTGISVSDLANDDCLLQFQLKLASMQMLLEDFLKQMARFSKKHVVILADRAVFDGKAYMSAPLWQKVLKEMKLDEMAIRDRYDAVIFLRSSAFGFEEFYNAGQKDNKVRYESAEAARQTDQRLLESWSIHDKLTVVNSYEDFDMKCREVVKAVENIMGVPMPADHRKKYLLKSSPIIFYPDECDSVKSIRNIDVTVNGITQRLDVVEFLVEMTFLAATTSSQKEVRLIRRIQNQHESFTLMSKKTVSTKKIETERSLSPSLYTEFLNSRRDTSRAPLRIRRRCFLLNNHYYKIDEYLNIPHFDALVEPTSTESHHLHIGKLHEQIHHHHHHHHHDHHAHHAQHAHQHKQVDITSPNTDSSPDLSMIAEQFITKQSDVPEEGQFARHHYTAENPLVILNIETDHPETIELPSFMDVVRDVTDEGAYASQQLAFKAIRR